MEDLVNNVKIYQKKLEKYTLSKETDKLIYYLSKLKHLPINVRHLELTGVGRTVNALRHYEGQVGDRARNLVTTWMDVVTAEESNKPITSSSSSSNNNNGRTASDDDHRDDYSKKKAARSSVAEVGSPRTSKQQQPPPPQDNYDEEEDYDEEDDGERLQIEEMESNNQSPEDNDDDDDYGELPKNHKFSGHLDTSIDSNSYVPANSTQDYNKYNTNNCSSSNNKYVNALSKYGEPASCSDGEHSPKYDPFTSTKDYESINSNSREALVYEPTSILSPAENSCGSDGEGQEEVEISGGHKSRSSDHKSSRSKHKEKEKSRDKKHKSHSRDKDSKDKHRHKSSDKEKERSHKDKRKERSPSKKHRDHSENNKADANEALDKRLSKSHKDGDINNVNRLGEDNDSPDGSPYDDAFLVNGHNLLPDIEINTIDEFSAVASSSKHQSSEKHSTKSSNRSKEHKKDDKYKKDKKRDRDEDKASSEHKSERRKEEEEEDDDDDEGFGAALMGCDSSPKKKKSKTHHKSKEEKSHKSSKSNSKESSKRHSKSSSSQNNNNSTDRSEKSSKASTSKSSTSVEQPPTSLNNSFSATTPAVVKQDALQINPNYKPLPRLPLPDILDDDIDDYAMAVSEAKLVESRLTQEQLLEKMMNRAVKKRTIYSGKATCLSEVPSLFNLAVRCLQENIDALEYTGGIPFDLLKPVIERTTAAQLFNLENYNPYLLEDTHLLWEQHCKKDFRNKKPEEMETFRDMYTRLVDERDQKLKSLTENLQTKFVTKPAPRRTTQLAFVGTVAKPPKSVARAQAKYGTGVPAGTPAKTTKAAEIMARKNAMQNVNRTERSMAAARSSAASKKPKAPLMAKTMQFYKKTYRR